MIGGTKRAVGLAAAVAFAGIICQIAAVGVALLGLIPAKRALYRLTHFLSQDQIDTTYTGVYLLQAGMIALAGFAVGYLLFCRGTHLKSKITQRDRTGVKPTQDA
jgi:hypothetical protein